MAEVNGAVASAPAPASAATMSMDSAEYDPIEHLNIIFSHPSTLSSVDRTSKALQSYQGRLDSDIASLILEQSHSDVASVERIQAAKSELASLFDKVEDMRKRAQETEQAITEMTADIKRLDNTKKNLTLSMTALKRLQMLTTAYEQLRGLINTRQYRECAQLLQAVIQLMGHFKKYRSIDQIATLSRNVSDLQRELLEQVCEDFEITFAKGEIQQRRGMLSEACLVMDALGENARSRLITWYCNTQLREYRQVFRGSDEAGSLDNISRRFSWFKRMLKSYDEEHAFIFPTQWRVNEVLANSFCEGTREDFKAILAKSVKEKGNSTLDVNLLLSCLQETLEFEHTLARRFSGTSRASFETSISSDEKPPVFSQAISDAFEPYFGIWINAQDKQLATMFHKYRSLPARSVDEEFTSQSVIPSSTEIFNFYRVTLAQCAKLSAGGRLVDLSHVFGKYLDQYAQTVLLPYISDKPPSSKPPAEGTSLEDIVLVLNTADYCYSTSVSLEDKIKSRIDGPLKSSVDLQSQADAFMGIASACIRALVRRVELACEPAWRQMRNTAWNKIDNVGDHSAFIMALTETITSESSTIVPLLHKPQYARTFCDNLVEAIITTYLQNIVQCKPISETGAEQMLLDTFVLKSCLLSLLSPASSITPTSPRETQAPPAYAKRISHLLSRVLPLLKTLQVCPSPPEALVQAYLVHIADSSVPNFKKILELKGIRKAEQPHLVELFMAHRAASSHKDLPASNPVLANLGVGSSNERREPSSSMTVSASSTSLNLPARFDAATSALTTMIPTLNTTQSNGPQGADATRGVDESHHATVNLNENLKNLGRFFKRDLGGLGGRFGKGVSGRESRDES